MDVTCEVELEEDLLEARPCPCLTGRLWSVWERLQQGGVSERSLEGRQQLDTFGGRGGF